MNMNSIKLFTIGYTKRSAEIFFSTLKQAEIKLLIDVRLNNTSQLAGYTKKDKHMPELAPTADILDGYKAKAIDWQTYELKFRQLLEDRNLIPLGETMNLDHACLLCAEPRPDKCHRRLVAEYLQKYNTEIELKHL
jgi:uncharacterized protein (DUF488 family)